MAVTYQGGDQILNYAPLRQDAIRWQANQQRQDALDAKSREQSAKQAADIVAKINPNGLRDADIPEFSKMYEKFRSAAINVANAGSIQDRAKASAELQNQLTDLQTFVNSSKNQAGVLKEFGTRLSANPFRANPNQFTRFDQVTKTPTRQLQNVDLGSEFRLGARPEVWTNQVKSVFDEVQQEVRNEKPRMVQLGVMRENGRTIRQYQYLANIPAETAKAKLVQRLESNSEAREAATEEAARLGITLPQYLDRIVEQNKGSLSWRSTPQSQEVTPRKTSGSGGGTPSGYLIQGQTQNFNRGKSTVTPAYTLQFDGGKDLTSGLFNFKDETGATKKIDAANLETKIASIGLYPVAKRTLRAGKNNISEGSILNTNYARNNPNEVVYKPMALITVKDKIGNGFKTYYANPDDVLAKVGLSKKRLAGYSELISKLEALNRGRGTQERGTAPTPITGNVR